MVEYIMKKRVGIITYHAAYNIGSVLQAYATQEIIKDIGYEPLIINYRLKSQKEYYIPLYRTHFGYKKFLKDIEMMPVARARKERTNNFEQFICNMLDLTEEVSVPKDVNHLYEQFEVIISGSDQIWNLHSFELEGQDPYYMMPYLLDNYRGRAISYASSVANMSDDELNWLLPHLETFHAISIREPSSAKKLREAYGIDVVNVPDPTMLLSPSEWISKLSLDRKGESNYCLYYSLEESNKQLMKIGILRKIAKKLKCPIHIVTPFAYLPCDGKWLVNCPSFGPREFLEDLINARTIITDSYHGTVLSILFKKNLHSIITNNGSEYRKTDVLEKFQLKNCIINSLDELMYKDIETPYSEDIDRKLQIFRYTGIKYLSENI